MRYSYFGNTTLRPKTLLYNIEKQLFLFEELFNNAENGEEWTGNEILQEKYYYMLIKSDLLKTKTSLKLDTKDARAKSSPLEDMGLINRSEKFITPQGLQLLEMLRNKDFLKFNNFLQIDLVSLFFLKIFFGYSKKDNPNSYNDFIFYLSFFIIGKGTLTKEQFLLLPLFRNIKLFPFRIKLFDRKLNYNEFITNTIRNDEEITRKKREFIFHYKNSNFDELTKILKSSNGGNSGKIALNLLDILIKLRNNNCTQSDIDKLFLNKIDNKNNHIKTLYIKYLLPRNAKFRDYTSLEPILNYFNQENELDFIENFYEFIEICRCKNNLKDYADLNRRYLSLTGIFEFNTDSVSIIKTMTIFLQAFSILKLNKFFSEEIEIKENTFDFLFANLKVKTILNSYGLNNTTRELKFYKYNQDKIKLERIIQEKFSKENLIKNILPLFKDRQDSKIKSLVTDSATVPTIYEYVIALSWYYIDNKNIDFILKAGLSLDNDMLPKSHAVGGSSDFEYDYGNHKLMIEVTLTDGTNQRRAEMESVSRHLGQMLLKIDDINKRKNSFGIFIASYLDRNVLNDFRSRRNIPWENSIGEYVEGMNILPLNTEDIIEILISNKTYSSLIDTFRMLINDTETRGSQWYINSIKTYIDHLNHR
ncbi:AlwI family type II restriction endonuclease [Aliarcobacter cryaerophilus]|uniref:AlwI family type II restriction endonuclease n=1 Tax=Aliarcobacter cryaerophilus TaxID=28198 RepID=UPI0021B18481|nr:AlwI family type II restriction endonuclease [Aliarcobacter cryaerophilus]MCT7495897.1 AlwI family type II restriction endonuclease [Aliarcobacter cryaerophilus]